MPEPTTPKKPWQKMHAYRLPEETIADLDLIANDLAARDNSQPNRTAAIRFAAREAAKRIERRTQK